MLPVFNRAGSVKKLGDSFSGRAHLMDGGVNGLRPGHFHSSANVPVSFSSKIYCKTCSLVNSIVSKDSSSLFGIYQSSSGFVTVVMI